MSECLGKALLAAFGDLKVPARGSLDFSTLHRDFLYRGFDTHEFQEAVDWLIEQDFLAAYSSYSEGYVLTEAGAAARDSLRD